MPLILMVLEDGLSADFIAHSDIARVHSKCRLCTRTADLQRLDVGQQFAGNPWQQENVQAAKNSSPGSRSMYSTSQVFHLFNSST
jgi:hypothetical protein